METQLQIICPSCKSPVSSTAYFCSNCGRPLKVKPPATTFLQQCIVYAVSLLLPPFGFLYAWKYLKSNDENARKIGIAAVVLTTLSFVVTIWFIGIFLNFLGSSLGSITNLGF